MLIMGSKYFILSTFFFIKGQKMANFCSGMTSFSEKMSNYLGIYCLNCSTLFFNLYLPTMGEEFVLLYHPAF